VNCSGVERAARRDAELARLGLEQFEWTLAILQAQGGDYVAATSMLEQLGEARAAIAAAIDRGEFARASELIEEAGELSLEFSLHRINAFGARERLQRFLERTRAVVEATSALYEAGDAAAGELLGPVVELAETIDAALAAGELEQANELLDDVSAAERMCGYLLHREQEVAPQLAAQHEQEEAERVEAMAQRLEKRAEPLAADGLRRQRQRILAHRDSFSSLLDEALAGIVRVVVGGERERRTRPRGRRSRTVGPGRDPPRPSGSDPDGGLSRPSQAGTP
jgi:hypothetical protein